MPGWIYGGLALQEISIKTVRSMDQLSQPKLSKPYPVPVTNHQGFRTRSGNIIKLHPHIPRGAVRRRDAVTASLKGELGAVGSCSPHCFRPHRQRESQTSNSKKNDRKLHEVDSIDSTGSTHPTHTCQQCISCGIAQNSSWRPGDGSLHAAMEPIKRFPGLAYQPPSPVSPMP